MNQLAENSLSNRSKYTVWGILSLYILAHLLPYVPKYTLPHGDLLKILSIINYIQSPELFQGDNLTKAIAYFNSMTAPIYFFGLTYPLSHLLPARWVLFTIGAVITLGSAYFAGQSWDTWLNVLVATTSVIILLHLFLNPLEGNRRSFTAFFLLSLFWMESRKSYLLELFLIGLSAGIYPPATLIMVLYLGIGKLRLSVLGEKKWRTTLLEGIGFGVVMITILSPYLLNILFSETEPIFFSLTLGEDYFTKTSLFNAFVNGTKTALFKNPSHFDIFSILLFILFAELLLLRQKFSFQFRYTKLLISGLTLWVLAHLLHPVIYHPFKYTRLTLVLGITFPVVENLPHFAVQLRSKVSGNIFLKFSSLIVSTGILGVLAALIVQKEMWLFENLPVWGIDGWKFFLALPIFLTALVIMKDFLNSIEIVCLISMILLLLLIYLPHDFYHDEEVFSLRGLTFKDFDGMYKFLRGTPPGTIVAGPPLFYMDPISAFAKRPTFLSYNRGIVRGTCERTNQFWKAYFSESLSDVSSFMKKNNIDYILVDREVFRGEKRYIPGFSMDKCELPDRNEIREILGTKSPALNSHFQDTAWSKNRRLYLISYETLRELKSGASKYSLRMF